MTRESLHRFCAGSRVRNWRPADAERRRVDRSGLRGVGETLALPHQIAAQVRVSAGIIDRAMRMFMAAEPLFWKCRRRAIPRRAPHKRGSERLEAKTRAIEQPPNCVMTFDQRVFGEAPQIVVDPDAVERKGVSGEYPPA